MIFAVDQVLPTFAPGLLLAGVDEAGRGPLAGPVAAAAVILDPARPIAGLADSKVLSASRRDDLAKLIEQRALSWAVCFAEAEAQDLDYLLPNGRDFAQ